MGKESKNIVATGVIFALLALVLGYFVYDMNEQVTVLNGEITALEAEITTLTAKANKKQLKAKQKTLGQLQYAVNQYVQILPNRLIATEDSIVKVFSDYAKRSEIRILDIVKGSQRGQRGRRGKKKGKKKDFEEINANFSIVGNFANFVRFLGFLERHQNFLQVRSFNLNTRPTNPEDPSSVGQLSASLGVQTFRYNASSKKGK
jgi:hypothetical protein